MEEEWCLIAQLDGEEADIAALVARAGDELTFADRLTRDGLLLRVYTQSEPVAARAEEELLALIEETTLGYELWQERWNDESGEWEELAPEGGEQTGARGSATAEAATTAEDPSTEESYSFENAGSGLDPASIEGMGARRRGCWVVKAELPDAEAAEAFLESLRSRGAVAGRVGHKVGMLVADSGTAASVQAALEKLAPAGSSVTAQEASRVERVAYGSS
jgi:hypothetical protein